ncbi:tRNA lysidine(34) synthetase TilS [uncultured Sphingomonas sp.]|uniref:tRNA lysidine(34) synthetase TilS n=1 Tax=uncultured Sphingomonas sp. TaxID=158754 RepID=UPI0025833693|nr:tRNA lysidine(34) synthetase TilS [uncultured Sphingomonas sp.]
MTPVPPPDAAVARFRDDLARVTAAAFDGATPPAQARIALAVSGGADSMAMLALAAAAHPGRVVAATFDHRLRAGSSDEAAMVARVGAALAVPHRTLAPIDAIAGSSIQMRARVARYAALVDWAAAEGAAVLLTAHHADDQAETLLMRLNRGAGLSGLAAIRPWRFDGAVAVLRPLLGWRRAELRTVAQAAAMPFVDDPSNDDARHDRTRMRALLAAAPALDPVRLAASAMWLGEAEAVLARLAERLWEERWRGPDRPFAIADEERELRRRLVRRAIIAVRESAAIVLPAFDDSTNVEPLLGALEAGRGAVQGGVKVSPTPAGWRFSVPPPRRSV